MPNRNDITGQTPDRVMKIAYRVSEAAAAAGLSRSTLYESIRIGALPIKKCGRRTLVLHDDLVEFLRNLP